MRIRFCKGFTRIVLGLLLVFVGSMHFSVLQAMPPRTETQSTRVVLPQWRFEPGPLNAITDVAGVKVGHVTIWRDHPYPIRTGVTAIVPHSRDLARTGLWANGRMLHGNGELTGLWFVRATGILNTPILLTNTFSVGQVSRGVFDYYRRHYPGKTPGSTVWPGQLPVVGECYDGYFNTIEDPSAVMPEDAVQAIELARGGAISQGRVGAGTGMRSFGLYAGIGTASRQVMIDGKQYTLGVLVNMNHSRFADLNPVIRTELEKRFGRPLDEIHREDSRNLVPRASSAIQRQGSIIVVIATDLPLLPYQLEQLALRAALGIGALGSTMASTSGDGVIAFSTAQPVPLGDNAPVVLPLQVIHPDYLSPIYRATVEAVTEAQINALVAAHMSR